MSWIALMMTLALGLASPSAPPSPSQSQRDVPPQAPANAKADAGSNAKTNARTSAQSVASILRVPADTPGLTLALHHRPPSPRGGERPSGRSVLFVHGATFPSALAAGYRFDGRSWMDDLAAEGFDVWALDFLGYGESSRYPEMDGPMDGAPLGRAPDAARQIAAAVAAIRARQHVERVSIIAHSWGTIPAGLFATEQAGWVDRLVLFGAVGPTSPSSSPSTAPAPSSSAPPAPAAPPSRYGLVTAEQQRARFTGYVPAGHDQVFAARLLDPWLAAYLAADPTSAARQPASVRVPSGAAADLGAARRGTLGYDPGAILAPTLIIRGEWDTVTTADVVAWLFERLSRARDRRSVLLSRGTHVMHLESGRTALYREVALFLREPPSDDAAPSPRD